MRLHNNIFVLAAISALTPRPSSGGSLADGRHAHRAAVHLRHRTTSTSTSAGRDETSMGVVDPASHHPRAHRRERLLLPERPFLLDLGYKAVGGGMCVDGEGRTFDWGCRDVGPGMEFFRCVTGCPKKGLLGVEERREVMRAGGGGGGGGSRTYQGCCCLYEDGELDESEFPDFRGEGDGGTGDVESADNSVEENEDGYTLEVFCYKPHFLFQ